MDFLGDGRAEQSEQATEAGEVRGSFGVIVGEAPVNQVTAQFAFQIAEAPAFPVLEHTATQQAIGGDAGATGTGGLGTARGQALAH